MNTPGDTTSSDTAALEAAVSLETIELELALQSQDTVQAGFEGALRQALDKAGGTLLFHMRVDDENGTHWTAAVSVGSGEDRQLLIVTIPSDGPARIEPTEESTEPLARIAPAFADVMEKLQHAA
jgi:hypothetical protein